MSRQEFPVSVKKAAWARCGGACEACGMRFAAGLTPEYDHDNPDALTGEPTLENCVVLCRGCHKAKTAEDRRRITKAHRLARKAAGITARKQLIPGSKGTRFKRRVDGTVERRDA